MHGVRQWWVRLSILHKAIVLSCAFVIPILLVVGLLMNDFYDYREKSDDILSEYARCTDYMNAMEQENALLGELTFAAPESDTIDKYADAVQDTASAWVRLRSAETDGSTQSEVLKQVIDRTMKSYRVRQETFIAQLHDGTFDAVSYEALRTQGSYLTQYTDQLTAAFLMEGREGYLVLGQRGTSQNMVFTIVAAIGSVLFAGAMLYYARSLLLPVQQMSRGAHRVADGEYDIEDFNFARSDEIGMLADSFNHLKHQIARTIHALESEAQLEKSLRQQESEAARLRQLIEQSRFAQLQSQINPHFLFNTLQSVANMAGIEQATVTGDMVVRLANFFRYTLDHDDSVVTLDRELALLRDYISLHRLSRLGRPGHHYRHDQGVRPDAKLFHGRHSDVRADGKLFDTFQGCGWAVPLYPLPAWSSEGRSRSGSNRGFHRVRCHDRYRRRIRCYHGHAVRTGAAEVRL